MAVPTHCSHSFQMLKSDTNLIQWFCSMCNWGPHWSIYECKYCKAKYCRSCINKA
ncbi:hypothetical protein BJ875DRAFT_204857 [Amylocarpus encephaloides]|uniref:Uncharacterized protein n=1 Tax=Amylocarpus encephaloides TaxID=45428 RepID=A0A9P7Y8B3_9HELO|nr:hypothetical protein BJ875DRAFT_204857 [Amylocarpus encephaloides]